jgi:hypothetical protein
MHITDAARRINRECRNTVERFATFAICVSNPRFSSRVATFPFVGDLYNVENEAERISSCFHGKDFTIEVCAWFEAFDGIE